MKKKIVVVDDFENTRYVVKLSLRTLDVEIIEAPNGSEALKYFNGQDIDILITDLNMPVMDGTQLVKRIRDMDKYQFIPVIMLTTERNEKKKEQAMEVKVTAWIQKPFKQEDFLKVVKKCLRIE